MFGLINALGWAPGKLPLEKAKPDAIVQHCLSSLALPHTIRYLQFPSYHKRGNPIGELPKKQLKWGWFTGGWCIEQTLMQKHLTSSTQDHRRQDSSCSFPYMAAPDVSKSMGTVWRLQVSSADKHTQITAVPREAQVATSSLSNLLKANTAMLRCWEATELRTLPVDKAAALQLKSFWSVGRFSSEGLSRISQNLWCAEEFKKYLKKKKRKRKPIKEKTESSSDEPVLPQISLVVPKKLLPRPGRTAANTLTPHKHLKSLNAHSKWTSSVFVWTLFLAGAETWADNSPWDTRGAGFSHSCVLIWLKRQISKITGQ